LYDRGVPELPDVTIYADAVRQRVLGESIARVRVVSPFVLRTFEPPVEAAEGRRIVNVFRIGKRVVLALEDELFLVVHLMIAGRFRWADGPDAKPAGGKITLATLHFDSGVLAVTEASTKKRASLHLVAGREALWQFARGGTDVLDCELSAFRDALTRERHTLKRALTDPRLFDGIGNAYSDEILHAARLSPFKITTAHGADEIARLYEAVRGTMSLWIARLREEFADGGGGLRFPGPGEITAFRPDFAVHGRFGKPCPVCGTKVQRVVYSEREFNYCPTCQTEGRILADRSLSRLLRDDFPRTVQELEAMEE
jgi:formamidopyrimidine-DNA glycosylase